MINRKHILMILVLFVVAFGESSAQKFKRKVDSLYTSYRINRADKAYDNMAYKKAIDRYQSMYNKQTLPDSVKGQLAIAYFKVSETSKAEEVFATIPEENLNDEELFLYAQTLKYNGKYNQADGLIERFHNINASDSRGVKQLNATPEIEKILSEERYLIEELDINSTQSDFSPFVMEDKLYFTSARDIDYIVKRDYAWKETPYLNVFNAKIKEEGAFSNPNLFSGDMRSMYHDGPVCFNEAGDEMFITRNSFHSMLKKGKDGYNNLRILYSKKMIDGSWTKPEELPFNDPSFSCGHAFLTKDGQKMYFTSDRPGGYGGADIYYVLRSEQGWGEPINLGSEINTEGEEMFPFVDDKGQLYFASNGHLGVGGLDLFIASKVNEAYRVKNMGYPINTAKDDFSIFIMDDGINGYFASNREGGKGDDDIYRFKVLKEVAFKLPLNGRLVDQKTKQIIANTPVELRGPEGTVLANLVADAQGMIYTELDEHASITAIVNAEDYFPYMETLQMVTGTTEFELALVPKPYYGIYGSVFLLPDMTPISDVSLKIEAKNGAEDLAATNEEGAFKTKLLPDTDYDIVFTKKQFFTKRVKYSTLGRDTGYVNLNEFMELELEEAKVGKSIEIQVLYDLGKWNIREDAAVELDDMIQFLNDNPNIKIELSSHTDARGSRSSNQSLSQKRAESAVNYMVENGISKERMQAKGYGETRLKNKCADGVKCSEEEHQANRRTEVTIIEM